MTKKSIHRLSILLFLILLIFTQKSYAQNGWNWPSDPEKKKLSQEKQAYYKVLLAQEKHAEALSEQHWLFMNNPNLHASIYKDAAKIIEHLLKAELEEGRKTSLEDSLLWTYDMRIQYFPSDKSSAIDRKAYSAFKLYYKTSSKYQSLLNYYEDLFKLPATEISKFNLTPYMTLATYYYKAKPSDFPAEKVIDVYDKVTNVIEAKMELGSNMKGYINEQNKIDAFLSTLEPVLNCDFINENFVSKLKKDPNDLNTAKKIFSFSVKAKCTDKPYFLEAGALLYKEKPTFVLAKALGDKYYFSGEYQQANKYYLEAEKLGTSDLELYQALYGQALTQSKLGNKPKSRALARQAISKQSDNQDAYNLIGNLYFTSYDDCKAGVSKVSDRAVFIAAYIMYEKSGNTTQMEACTNQFPSIEDIFNEGKEEGESITVGCWINETVALQRR